MKISIEDLVIAYRKAKTDAFYERGHLTANLFIAYEKKLIKNLKNLHVELHTHNSEWFSSEEFTGSIIFIPKGYDDNKDSKSENLKQNVFFSDPKREFENSQHSYKFRLIGYKHSIDFHVLSSLWLDKVGYKLEETISKNSYGYKLRQPTGNAQIADLPSHFNKYAYSYKKWQSDALNKVKDELNNKKDVVLLTADIKKFYHSISSDFLLSPEFLNLLNEEEIMLTEMLVNIYNSWSDNSLKNLSSDSKYVSPINGRNHIGLPIGISASKVISNLFLNQFDNDIETKVRPVFYGRYVDDMVFVFRDNQELVNSKDVWKLISNSINLNYDSISESKLKLVAKGYEYTTHFDSKQDVSILFPREKEKLFILNGKSGLIYLEAIQNHLNEISSDWRKLPEPEENLETLYSTISNVSKDGDSVNGLRKSDGISLKRMQFAIELRNIEALVNLIDNIEIKGYISKFYEFIFQNLSSPKELFNYYSFFPRIFALAVRIKDFELCSEFIVMLNNILKQIGRFQSNDFEFKSFKFYLKETINEALVSAYQTESVKESDFVDEALENFINKNRRWINYKLKDVYRISRTFLYYDFHRNSFKNWISEDPSRLSSHSSHISSIGSEKNFLIKQHINALFSFFDVYKDKVGLMTRNIPSSLYFFTRPFTILDITLSIPNWAIEDDEILGAFSKLYYPGVKYSSITNPEGNDKTLIKLNDKGLEFSNPTIALTSQLTSRDSWTADVMEQKEPDLTRVTRIFRTINSILKCGKRVDYIIFPELSVPQEQLKYIALRLSRAKISLICGSSYFHQDSDNDIVENQLVYILYQNIKGFNHQYAIRQSKSIPALGEEQRLWSAAGLRMTSNNLKYIINHNGFFMSGLICNELLDINYRKQLRGKIDMLVIPEWNKDIGTYSPLVESTSMDLHCYIAQVNNREYGDTRMRAPYKDRWRRDLARVKGGELDYFVLVSLDVKSLREFQMMHRSPDGPFKPVPPGFRISENRELS